MFIWDFVAETVLGQIIDWFYGQLIGFLGNFFAEMGSMGADLFKMSWVQSIVLFFVYLAWALYGTRSEDFQLGQSDMPRTSQADERIKSARTPNTLPNTSIHA
jgi:hypothetical protein